MTEERRGRDAEDDEHQDDASGHAAALAKSPAGLSTSTAITIT